MANNRSLISFDAGEYREIAVRSSDCFCFVKTSFRFVRFQITWRCCLYFVFSNCLYYFLFIYRYVLLNKSMTAEKLGGNL